MASLLGGIDPITDLTVVPSWLELATPTEWLVSCYFQGKPYNTFSKIPEFLLFSSILAEAKKNNAMFSYVSNFWKGGNLTFIRKNRIKLPAVSPPLVDRPGEGSSPDQRLHLHPGGLSMCRGCCHDSRVQQILGCGGKKQTCFCGGLCFSTTNHCGIWWKPIFKSGSVLIPAALLPKNVKGIHLQPRDLFGKNGRTTFLIGDEYLRVTKRRCQEFWLKMAGGFEAIRLYLPVF